MVVGNDEASQFVGFYLFEINSNDFRLKVWKQADERKKRVSAFIRTKGV